MTREDLGAALGLLPSKSYLDSLESPIKIENLDRKVELLPVKTDLDASLGVLLPKADIESLDLGKKFLDLEKKVGVLPTKEDLQSQFGSIPNGVASEELDGKLSSVLTKEDFEISIES